MEYLLDRSIRFKTEIEYKSLYQWALQEVAADGKVIGRDQIPWGWTLSFSATDMRLVQYVEANGDGTKAEARETIQIVLVPYRHNGFPPHFSMFGTDRIIKDITLSVRRASQDNPSQTCSLWGIISYTTLERETYPDALGFEVSLADQHFEALRHAALGVGGEYSILLDVSRAAGFYSDWSPDIYTSRVKVLTAYPEQRVNYLPTARMCQGSARSASLSLQSPDAQCLQPGTLPCLKR